MDKVSAYPYTDRDVRKALTANEYDYVKGGTVYVGERSKSVMIESQANLADLQGYAPGAIAYLAGFARLWQLKSDGTWVELGGEENG